MIRIYAFFSNELSLLAERQVNSLSRNLDDPFEYFLVNNGVGAAKEAFDKVAAELEAPCIKPEGVDHSLTGLSHQCAMQWVWNTHAKFQRDPVVFLDGDIELIRKFSIQQRFQTKSATYFHGVKQRRGKEWYPWPGCLYIWDYKALFDFNLDLIGRNTLSFFGIRVNGHHLDSGGNLGVHIREHGLGQHYRRMPIEYLHPRSPSLKKYAEAAEDFDKRYQIQLIDGVWLHFRNGSHWEHASDSFVTSKIKWYLKILDILEKA